MKKSCKSKCVGLVCELKLDHEGPHEAKTPGGSTQKWANERDVRAWLAAQGAAGRPALSKLDEASEKEVEKA